MDQQLMSNQCEGRYPVPQTAPPREEAVQMTYRCGLRKGHSGSHGPIGGFPEPMQIPAVPWREGAIWLRNEGYSYVVLIERDGKWIEIIRDSGKCSHITEALGINNRIAHSAEGDK